MEEVDSHFEQFKGVVQTLKAKNAALADENAALRRQLDEAKAELGNRLYQDKDRLAELVRAVDGMKQSVDRKKAMRGSKAATNKYGFLDIVDNASGAHARKLLEGGDEVFVMPERTAETL